LIIDLGQDEQDGQDKDRRYPVDPVKRRNRSDSNNKHVLSEVEWIVNNK
jgi:hypothetical protein